VWGRQIAVKEVFFPRKLEVTPNAGAAFDFLLQKAVKPETQR